MDLLAKYMEEVHDYKEYKHMHREAKNEDKHELAFWLDRIAADERSHAKWLHDYLCHHDMMTDKGRELWDEIN